MLEGRSSNLNPVAAAAAAAQTSSSSLLPDFKAGQVTILNRAISDEAFLGRVGSSGSGSSSSSSGSSSGASSLLVGGFLPRSGQSSPVTSRSNSAHDPLESADHAAEVPLLRPSFKAQGKRKLSDLLSDHLVASPDATSKTFAGLSKHEEDDDDGSLPVVSEPIEEPIFPVTLYNSAYRFFPSRNPSSSARPHPHLHPPSEAQCPWAIQEAVWGKEAKRCGRSFASPEMLARHVLLVHCQIGPAPHRHSQAHASSSSNMASLSQSASNTTVSATALPSSSTQPTSATTSRSVPTVTKVPCRYGTCNNRSFTSTAKMRAHVLQVHLLPTFLYNCPFENCRLTASEQPDTQHKLDGHIDRIHDEEDEHLRPFTRSGGIGPKGARFSLLKKIPATILDKDKGGVQPGAAWAHMQRAASVSGIDLDAAFLVKLVVPPSGVGGTGFEPAMNLGPPRGRTGEDASSAIVIDEGPTVPATQYFTDASLSELETDTALKLNAIEKAGRISSEDFDGHWLHQPLALRPPLPKPRGKGAKAASKLGSKGSPTKASAVCAYPHLNFKAIYEALDQEIAQRRTRSLAASRNPKVSSAHRALIHAPTHPASSQNLPMLPSRVQPYVSLVAKMSYWERPAIPQLPSETMLALSLPAASSDKAGEVFARRHAKARARILEAHRVGGGAGPAGSSTSTLPRRQPFLDVYLDRRERTVPVEGIEFKKAGEGAFDCVEVPISDEYKSISKVYQEEARVYRAEAGSDPVAEGPKPSANDNVAEGTKTSASEAAVEGGPMGPAIIIDSASDSEEAGDLPPSLTASGFLERLEIPSGLNSGRNSGTRTPGDSSSESAIGGNRMVVERDAEPMTSEEDDRMSIEGTTEEQALGGRSLTASTPAEAFLPEAPPPRRDTDPEPDREDDAARRRRAAQSANWDVEFGVGLDDPDPWVLNIDTSLPTF